VAALKNPKHEAFCREAAGGLSYDQAWVAIGNSAASNNVGRLVRRLEIQARIAELREEFNRSSGINLAYLQQKLLPIATSDLTRYFHRSRDGKLKLRDVTKLPPELRSALAELRIDPDGSVTIKPWDKIGAINSLIKTVGGFAPRHIEITGKNGGPIETGDTLTPVETVRRLAWAVNATLRELADDVDTQLLGARWVRDAANLVLRETEGTRPELEVAAALPPMECARETLIAMTKCAQRIAPDSEAATFTVKVLRQIADGIEEAAVPKIVHATPEGAS
jgi:hypothetical protein